MKWRGLAARLVLSHLLVIVLGLGIAGTAILSQARRYFVDADRRALMVQARVAAAACDDECLRQRTRAVSIREDQLPAAANVAQRQSNRPSNIQVQVDEPSQVSASLPSDVRVIRASDPIDALSDPAARALTGREASGTNGDTLIVAAPIRRGKQTVGAIEVRAALSNVNTVLGDLRGQMLLALGCATLGALVFGLWRARSIARPVRELTVASRAIADGRFDQTLPRARGRDELAQLTQSFGDMRARVLAELALRNAFVADASHELRTPLTAIRGAVEILQQGGAERPEVRDRFLASLDRETERLMGLVDNLLALQAGEHATVPDEIVRMDELLRTVTADLAPTAERADVALTLANPSALRVRGGADHLYQVVVNLMANAISHSPKSGVVHVRMEGDAGRCRVDIDDQGPGVAEIDRERVFERFVRLDGARTRVRGGAGLGLPIARAIAKAHGGTVTLHEGPDGTGTTARLLLPLAIEGTPDETATAGAAGVADANLQPIVDSTITAR